MLRSKTYFFRRRNGGNGTVPAHASTSRADPAPEPEPRQTPSDALPPPRSAEQGRRTSNAQHVLYGAMDSGKARYSERDALRQAGSSREQDQDASRYSLRMLPRVVSRTGGVGNTVASSAMPEYGKDSDAGYPPSSSTTHAVKAQPHQRDFFKWSRKRREIHRRHQEHQQKRAAAVAGMHPSTTYADHAETVSRSAQPALSSAAPAIASTEPVQATLPQQPEDYRPDPTVSQSVPPAAVATPVYARHEHEAAKDGHIHPDTESPNPEVSTSVSHGAIGDYVGSTKDPATDALGMDASLASIDVTVPNMRRRTTSSRDDRAETAVPATRARMRQSSAALGSQTDNLHTPSHVVPDPSTAALVDESSAALQIHSMVRTGPTGRMAAPGAQDPLTLPPPPLRYSNADIRMSGWLVKRGKRFGSRVERFLVLNGCTLSNCRAENMPPTWSVNLRGCKILPGANREIIFKLGKNFSSFFAPDEATHAKWLKALQSVSGMVADYYDFGKRIGRGAYSEVFIARDQKRNELCAVKVLNRVNAEHTKLIDRELKILRMLHNEYLVRTIDIFDTPAQTYVVMEYLAGGELLDMITDSDHLSERNAKHVMRQVLEAVLYLHRKGIVHRDVKPENILCVNRRFPLRVKLTDFGLSKVVSSDEIGTSEMTMRSQCGTAYYLAPEIASNLNYGKPVDMWACGVVGYVMLAGKFPFYGDTDEKFMKRLRAGVKFPNKEWRNVSQQAKSLIRGLLDPNPDTRLTAKEALEHRWLCEDTDDMLATASSKPARTVGEQRERERLQYAAHNESLSLQLGTYASGSGGSGAERERRRASSSTGDDAYDHIPLDEDVVLRTEELTPSSHEDYDGVGAAQSSNAAHEPLLYGYDDTAMAADGAAAAAYLDYADAPALPYGGTDALASPDDESMIIGQHFQRLPAHTPAALPAARLSDAAR